MAKERVLFYSFRTNKYLPEFKKSGFEVFVFGKLTEDLGKFKTLIKKNKPRYIIGLAAVKGKTCVEPVTVNRFGKKGQINKNGQDSYCLEIPPNNKFLISAQPSRSFCNWTMYKIKEIINNTETKLVFIHFNHKDLTAVLNFLKNL